MSASCLQESERERSVDIFLGVSLQLVGLYSITNLGHFFFSLIFKLYCMYFCLEKCDIILRKG